MREFTKIKITPKGERSVKHGHPWVFGDEVIDIDGTYENGDLVDVLTNKGKYLGTGFINDNSKFPQMLMISLMKHFGNVACVMLLIIAVK